MKPLIITMKISRLRKILFIFSLFLFFGISKQTTAQEVSISAKLDKGAVLIGDTVSLIFHFIQPTNLKISCPEMKVNEELLPDLEIVDIISNDSVENNGILEFSKTIRLQSFGLDTFLIEPFVFTYPNGEIVDTLRTPELILFGYYQQAADLDTTKINPETHLVDIESNENTPLTFKEFMKRFGIYILIGIIVLVAAFFIVRKYLNKPKVVKPDVVKEVVIPANEIALKALRELEEKQLWLSNVKLYHSELTDIIRQYIESRFQFPTLERTSSEILHSFEYNTLIDNYCLELLRRMLTLADMVKFAKHIPLADENKYSMKHAFEFVEKTALQQNQSTN